MNSLNIVGRFVSDPTFKVTQNGKEVTTFTIAVDNRFDPDNANFFDCVSFGKTAENIANHFHKGKQIAITGRIQQERWEKDGQKRSKVSIICEQFTFVGSKDD